MLVVGDASVGNTDGGSVDELGWVCRATLLVPAQVAQGTAARRQHCLRSRRRNAPRTVRRQETNSCWRRVTCGMIHECSLAKSVTPGEEKGESMRGESSGAWCALSSGHGGTWPAGKERERRGKASPCLNPSESL